MTLKLERHKTIESCGSMSPLRKATYTSIQMFVPLNWQPNANYHSAPHLLHSSIISISQGKKIYKYIIRKVLLSLAETNVLILFLCQDGKDMFPILEAVHTWHIQDRGNHTPEWHIGSCTSPAFPTQSSSWPESGSTAAAYRRGTAACRQRSHFGRLWSISQGMACHRRKRFAPAAHPVPLLAGTKALQPSWTQCVPRQPNPEAPE